MKTAIRILISFLVLNALVPIAMMLIGLIDPAALVRNFGIDATGESVAVGALVPSFALVTAAWTILAIVWLRRGGAEGFTMAWLLGALCIAAGILNAFSFARLGRSPFVDMPDAIRGLCILVLCLWARRAASRATPALAA